MCNEMLRAAYKPIWSPGLFELNLKSHHPLKLQWIYLSKARACSTTNILIKKIIVYLNAIAHLQQNTENRLYRMVKDNLEIT